MFSVPMSSLVEKALVGVSIGKISGCRCLCVSQPASISLSVKWNNVYTLICLSGIPC